ncbi:MAG: hypothetical protein DRP63_00270 [Planctomycetota bacterium]|nr:MAG: hypothetical protein DRP63_00270 [Planctomycetota bacterium]
MEGKSNGEEQFGQLAVTLGFASPEEVTEAIRLQRRLAQQGQTKLLGQILVERGVLSVEEAKQIFVLQGRTQLLCRACRSRFNLAASVSGDLFRCRVCGAAVNVVVSPEELRQKRRSDDPLIGLTLAGCRIQEVIDEDAISRSYKGWQMGQQRYVVMRVLKRHCLRDADLVKRFLKEAEAATKVRHPAISPVHSAGQVGGYFYSCHGYFEGPTLKERVERQERLPIKLAADVMLRLVNGVLTAHEQKVVHRNIRPENVVFPDAKDRPVLLGLGFYRHIARKIEGTPEAGVLLGSPEFMAPEQIEDYSRSDERSDMFSLGALFFYMLVGHSPFKAENSVEALARNLEGKHPHLADISDDIPEEICQIVDRMLERSPDRRFSSLEEVKAALEAISVDALPLRKASVDTAFVGYEQPPPALEQEAEKQLELPEPAPQSSAEAVAAAAERRIPAGVAGEGGISPRLPTPPTKAERPQRKKALVEKAPFIALGVIALVIVAVLVIKLSGGGGEGSARQEDAEVVAQQDLKRLLSFARECEKKGNYEAAVARARRRYNKHLNTSLARRFLQVATRFERLQQERKVADEWNSLKRWLEENKGKRGYLEEAERRVREFMRSHAGHTLAGEARRLLETLQKRESMAKAAAEVDDAEKQIKHLCQKGRYVTAYKMVGVQELRLGQCYRRVAAEFTQRFQKMRRFIEQQAQKSFEEAKKRALLWEKKGEVEKALEELAPIAGWLVWERRGEGEELAPLLELARKAQRLQGEIRARFRRGMMRARVVFNALVERAFNAAERKDFSSAQELLARADKLAKNAKLPTNIARRMLLWLSLAERFCSAHIDFLKSNIGKQIEIKTKSNIPYRGTLESFDGRKLGIRVQTGRVVSVGLDEVKEEYLRGFARLQMGEREGRLGEAALAFFSGGGNTALLEGIAGDLAKALRQQLKERAIWSRVSRIVCLFGGTASHKLRSEKARVSVARLDDGFGNALRLSDGSLVYPEPFSSYEYVLRFQFCCKKGKSALRVVLPLAAQRVVTLLLPAEGKHLSFQEAQGSSEDVSIRQGEWYEIEVRVVASSVAVILDGRKVLEAKNLTPQSIDRERLRLSVEKGAVWLLRQIYLAELK